MPHRFPARPPSAAAALPLEATHRGASATFLGLLAAATLVVAAGAARGQEADGTVSHGISSFGELKYPEGFPHFDYVNPDAPQGGTMSFLGTGALTTFDTLNPWILQGNAAQGLGLLHNSLMVGSADEPDSMYGLIAESVEVPEDRSWAIFTLRPEARFSDGEPITASDVVWTFNTLVERGHPSYRISLRDIAEVETLDDHRVRFTFREGAATRDLPMTVASISILPEHYYQDVDFTRSTLTPPVSSGEFRVAEVQPGRMIRYCKDPDYWAADLNVNVGVNNFDCYRYEYYADRTAAFEAFKVGGYHFHEENTASTWMEEYNFPAVNQGWVVREELEDGRPAGTQGFWINLRRAKFQDVRVRQALGLMFNFEWTNQTFFHGLYQRTEGFWDNTDMKASGLPEGEELATLERFRDQLPPEIFTEEVVTPPVAGGQQLDRSAVRQAGRLLDEAGWTLQDGQRRNAQGQLLSIEFIEDSAAIGRIINPYIENLRRIGIDARQVRIDAAQMQERTDNYDYDIRGARFVMSLSPSLELRQFFSSDAAASLGSPNLSGIADPVVDQLIELVIASEDRETVTHRVRALDRVLRFHRIWVPQWYSGYHRLAYWDVFGRPEQKPPFSRGDAYWWWDEEKFQALRAAGALR